MLQVTSPRLGVTKTLTLAVQHLAGLTPSALRRDHIVALALLPVLIDLLSNLRPLCVCQSEFLLPLWFFIPIGHLANNSPLGWGEGLMFLLDLSGTLQLLLRGHGGLDTTLYLYCVADPASLLWSRSKTSLCLSCSVNPPCLTSLYLSCALFTDPPSLCCFLSFLPIASSTPSATSWSSLRPTRGSPGCEKIDNQLNQAWTIVLDS